MKSGQRLVRESDGVSQIIEIKRMPEFEEEATCAWDVLAEVRSAEFDLRTWPRFDPAELPGLLRSRKLKQARGNVDRFYNLINLAPAAVTLHLADWYPQDGFPVAHRKRWRDDCDAIVDLVATNMLRTLDGIRDINAIVNICEFQVWSGKNVGSWVMYKLGTDRVRIWKGEESLADYKARYLAKLFEIEATGLRR